MVELITFDYILSTHLDCAYILYLTLFIMYFIFSISTFIYSRYLGTRGLFYSSEFILSSLFMFSISLLKWNLKYHLALNINLGKIYISDNFIFDNIITFDLLSLIGIILITFLTSIVITFGIEYMTREAFAYNVISTLMLFSSSIVCFIVSYSFGLMTMFWELAGTLSILLIDTYYSRIRTTQAVSRTYSLNRLSDGFIFGASGEIYVLCQTDALPVLFNILPLVQFEPSILSNLFFDITIPTVILFCIFCAAATKCAQFLLFVWLPDAMEAPTPASALIHSSTLVVMGIFMLLRFAPVLHLSITVLYIMSIVGALTIAYGSIFSTQTGDLKKAVAYSTISQIGYMFCGIAFLAFKSVLVYLVIHAVCKALLFIFVGYIVHMFGGTTSLRKMGGIYYIIPDIAIYMFILCIILAGAPYTIGYFAKELILYSILNTYSAASYLIIFCWIISFACTPFYLYRVCILPIFGRPRCTRRVYRNIAPLYTNYNFIDLDSNIYTNVYIHKFINNIQKWSVNGRFTALLHFVVIILIIFIGEFFVLMVSGFYGTSTTLFMQTPEDMSTYVLTSYYITSYYTIRNIQLLIIVLFAFSTLYYTIVNNLGTFNVIYHGIIVPIILIILVYILYTILYQIFI